MLRLNFFLVWKNLYLCRISNTINFRDDSGEVQQEPETYERAMDCIFQTTNNAGCNAQLLLMGALEEAYSYKKIETFEGTLMSPSQGAFSLQPRICLPNLRIKSKIAILEDLFFFRRFSTGSAEADIRN